MCMRLSPCLKSSCLCQTRCLDAVIRAWVAWCHLLYMQAEEAGCIWCRLQAPALHIPPATQLLPAGPFTPSRQGTPLQKLGDAVAAGLVSITGTGAAQLAGAGILPPLPAVGSTQPPLPLQEPPPVPPPALPPPRPAPARAPATPVHVAAAGTSRPADHARNAGAIIAGGSLLLSPAIHHCCQTHSHVKQGHL